MKPPLYFSPRNLLFAAFLSCAAFQPGCTTVVNNATPGSVVYVRGELHATLDQRFEEVARAASRALADLQFSEIVEKKDALLALYEAETADDVGIHIRIERVSDSFTTVRIRAGFLGDEKLEYAILSKLKEKL